MARPARLFLQSDDVIAVSFARELERENNAMRAALERIACANDFMAEAWLEKTGSYSSFDEPNSVQIARETLASLLACQVSPRPQTPPAAPCRTLG